MMMRPGDYDAVPALYEALGADLNDGNIISSESFIRR